jgi:diguanylate cyclase (GGDEF)-like protein
MKAFSGSQAWSSPWLRLAAALTIGVTGASLFVLAKRPVVEAGILSLGVAVLSLTLSSSTGLSLRPRRRGRLQSSDMATSLPGDEFVHLFIAMEFAAARRGRAVTLALFGFDDFEGFAQRHGAVEADHAVREFSRVLNRSTRKINLSARYGWRHETFLSVLADAHADGAAVFVARVRGELDTLRKNGPLPTISAGIAEYDASVKEPEELVRRAERALEAARAAGGDRVVTDERTDRSAAPQLRVG